MVRQRPAKPLPPVRIRASPPDRPRGPPKGGPLFVRGTQIRAVPAARCGGADPGRRRLRRRRRPVSRCGSRIRALFQMKQEIPFGTGPRRSKWDFLLHLGLSGDGLSHLISTIFEKLLAPARGIAYINNPQADMAQLVEHNLAKVGVAGSSPVVRSIAFPDRLGGPFSAKWPSGKAEACKAFTPGSNPGFASRSPKGPSERRAPFRSRVPDTNRAGGAVRGRGRRGIPAAGVLGRGVPCEPGYFSKWSRKSHPARDQDGPNGIFCSIWDSNLC